MTEIKTKGFIREDLPIYVWVCDRCKDMVRSNQKQTFDSYCDDCSWETTYEEFYDETEEIAK